MLERLLERITKRGAASFAELAGELDTSPEMIESMLRELERLGYLRQVEGCSDGACPGCSGQVSCRPARMWTLGARRLHHPEGQ